MRVPSTVPRLALRNDRKSSPFLPPLRYVLVYIYPSKASTNLPCSLCMCNIMAASAGYERNVSEVCQRGLGSDPWPFPADPGWFCSSDLVPTILFCNSYAVLSACAQSDGRIFSVYSVLTVLLYNRQYMCATTSSCFLGICVQMQIFCAHKLLRHFPSVHVKATRKQQIS